MFLKDLLAKDDARITGSVDVEVTSLALDSRNIKPGALFAAFKGAKVDGLAFVDKAIEAGARTVLAGSPAPANIQATWIEAKEPRQLLAKIASRFYGEQPEVIAAVTGTSGKTSVVNFLRQIYAQCGFGSASLGTLGVVMNDNESSGSLTTPDTITLHETLADLARRNVTHLALEASSHGLDQFRLDGVRLSAGAFTNLSRDHLDYHPTMGAYLQAKLRLVELLPPGASFVINADQDHAPEFTTAAKKRGLKIMTVGMKGEDIKLLARERLPAGQQLSLGGPWGRAELLLPLIGDFQAENALLAASLAIATNCPHTHVLPALERLNGVRGRMEKVAEKNSAGIYVDYAHKPDALIKLLEAMRPYTKGKLTVVFGCGGDRDAGKRPLMGEIATKLADSIIVTDDNPRSEDPASIRMQIMQAAPKAIEIGDRAQAIREAISGVSEGDVLVIAGKGHETGQTIGNQILPFSDHDAIRSALS